MIGCRDVGGVDEIEALSAALVVVRKFDLGVLVVACSAADHNLLARNIFHHQLQELVLAVSLLVPAAMSCRISPKYGYRWLQQ